MAIVQRHAPEYRRSWAEGKCLRNLWTRRDTRILESASEFASSIQLPLRNVVAGVPRTDFYVPGSILRIELDSSIHSRRGCGGFDCLGGRLPGV